jgi:phage baseplate assembly protein W
MALRIANKYPIDTKPRVAVGVRLPFSEPYVFSSTYTTQDQLKSNILNYLMTNPGERYMDPLYGAGLTAQVFEQLTVGNFDLLKQKIQSDIKTYFPTVIITSLEVFGNEDLNILKIELSYTVPSFQISDTIQITI